MEQKPLIEGYYIPEILRSWINIILKLNNKSIIHIKVSPLLSAVILVMYFSGYFKEFVLVFLSMLFHELGHTAAAFFLGKRIFYMKILPVGLSVSIGALFMSRSEKIIIYLCGPLINLLLVVLFLVLRLAIHIENDITTFLMYANIYLIAFNLIPALPLDGGNILREILTIRQGINSANRIMLTISLSISLVLILLGTVQFLNSSFNLSLIFIGLYMFSLLKMEKVEAAMMNMKDVIYRRSRLLKKGIYPARDLVVIKTMHLSDVIKCLDFDRFHIIHVLNEDLKLVKVFTEQDIIDAVFKYSADLTIEEYMEKGV